MQKNRFFLGCISKVRDEKSSPAFGEEPLFSTSISYAGRMEKPEAQLWFATVGIGGSDHIGASGSVCFLKKKKGSGKGELPEKVGEKRLFALTLIFASLLSV
ncbi:hypothetical protein ACWNXI_07545 [Caldibacillus thermoamylovorans]